MDRQVARAQISREERHLILAGYNVHGPQWGNVVHYVQQNAAQDGPIARLYLERNNVQLRRRVREALARDVARYDFQYRNTL